MTRVECVTCYSRHDMPMPDALRWVSHHQCTGRPFPLRVLPSLTAQASKKQARAMKPWSELHEDAEWLASTGCSAVMAAERLGVSWGALTRAYARHNTPLPRPWKQDAA